MAGPDQLSSLINRPPSYATTAGTSIQQHNTSYDHHHQFPPQPDQSSMVGMNHGGGGLISNQLIMPKNPQEISQIFDSGTGNSAMNDMGMFTNIFMGGGGGGDHHQNQGFLKSIEHEDSTGSSSLIVQGRSAAMERNPITGKSRFGGSSSGGGDMMTHDFLGIGGSRPTNFHEQHQQQRLEMEAINQQRPPFMNPFHQQLSHGGDSDIEKPMWDV